MLSLTRNVAARFEAGADSSVGCGRAQYQSIAKGVEVQPWIVSLWRHRYANPGLEGLQDKPRRQATSPLFCFYRKFEIVLVEPEQGLKSAVRFLNLVEDQDNGALHGGGLDPSRSGRRPSKPTGAATKSSPRRAFS